MIGTLLLAAPIRTFSITHQGMEQVSIFLTFLMRQKQWAFRTEHCRLKNFGGMIICISQKFHLFHSSAVAVLPRCHTHANIFSYRAYNLALKIHLISVSFSTTLSIFWLQLPQPFHSTNLILWRFAVTYWKFRPKNLIKEFPSIKLLLFFACNVAVKNFAPLHFGFIFGNPALVPIHL